MIHVATIHFGSARWIDVQLGYLKRTMTEPYMVWASLHDVPGDHSAKFDRTVLALGDHPGKLNLVGAEIAAQAQPDDLIMFLDGDAFPVVDPMPVVRRGLEYTSLVAVRRDENFGDEGRIRAPCVGVGPRLGAIHGDWSHGGSLGGAQWRARHRCRGEPPKGPGTHRDAMDALATKQPGESTSVVVRRLRGNRLPPWSGFRRAMARVDLVNRPRLSKRGQKLPYVGRVLRRLNKARLQRWEARTQRGAEALGQEMFEKLEARPGVLQGTHLTGQTQRTWGADVAGDTIGREACALQSSAGRNPELTTGGYQTLSSCTSDERACRCRGIPWSWRGYCRACRSR